MEDSKYCRQILLYLAYSMLLFNDKVKAFHRDIPIAQTSSSKSNQPLSTAGSVDVSSNSAWRGYIPRLEPGLRLRRSVYATSTLGSSYEAVRITSFSLDMLKSFDPPQDIELNDNSGTFDSNFSNSENRAAYPAFVDNISNQIGKILRDAYQRMARFTEAFIGYMRRVAAAVVILAASLSSTLSEAMPSSMNLKRFSAAGSSMITAVTMGGTKVAYASAIKKYQDLTAAQRLATTPLFFVSNTRGNSYLQEDVQAGKPEQKIIVYFMSSEDANDYMHEMAQTNAANANEFRITTISMEKVFSQIQSRKQSRKMGRYKMDTIFRIQPSSKQSANAEVIAGEGNRQKGVKQLEGVSIPMFTAPGMLIKRENGEVVTPYYFAYEDLKEDWNRMARASTSTAVSKEPKVQVADFTEVMQLAQGISVPSLFPEKEKALAARVLKNPQLAEAKKASLNPGIVPPRREIEMIKNFYRNEAGIPNEFSRARLMGQ